MEVGCGMQLIRDRLLILLIVWINILGVASASSVSRSCSGTIVDSVVEITVNLTVDITGDEDFYVIDELVPDGYSVTEPGGGSTDHAGHIKWLVIQDAVDTVHTYVITSSNINRTTEFIGYYGFEGDTDVRLIGGQSNLTIAPDYGITITSCSISDTTPDIGQAVTLSGTGGQVYGATPSEVIKVVVGFRESSGNWAGGDPVVIWSSVPGQVWQSWSGSNATISAPSDPGTYHVWVRNVPTLSNAIAIQEFKEATFTTPDEVREDRWDTAVTVIGSSNHAPVLEAIGNQSVNENSPLTIEILATDTNGDPITFSVTGLPSGASFSGQTFTWTPGYDQAGNYNVTFIADDGTAQDS